MMSDGSLDFSNLMISHGYVFQIEYDNAHRFSTGNIEAYCK